MGILKRVKTGLPSYATPGICPNTAYSAAEILANPCSLLPYSIARKENQQDVRQWMDEGIIKMCSEEPASALGRSLQRLEN